MGAFCCHGKQTKKQIIIILAILIVLTKQQLYNCHTASVVLVEMSFKNFLF